MQTQVKQKRVRVPMGSRATSTVTVPKWIGEIAPQPKKAVVHLLKTITFLKLKDYERQISIFQERHCMTFDAFEKNKVS